jgi:hemin uptake protein HemP
MNAPENPMTSDACETTATTGATPTAGTTGPTPPVLDSRDVLRGHQAVGIAHNGALYRLQTTRQGKLILTK